MRANAQRTAMLLLVALGAIGCSSPVDTPAKTKDSTQANPVATQGVLAQTDEEGFGEEPTVKASGPVSFAEANAAYESRQYSDAVGLFERYTAQRPNNAWGHFMLGLSAWKSGDLPKAEGAFEAALRIDPHHLKSLTNLSRVLIEQKRFDEAVGRLGEAATIDSGSADVQRLLGRAYCGQGKVDDCENAYRQAIALDEHDAWSLNNLGLVLMEQQRPDEALPLLARAVRLRKDVPEFQNNLGMALEHTGRFRAAAAAYRDALTAAPGYAKAEQNLARVEAVKVDAEEPFDLDATAGAPPIQPSPTDATSVQ
jgi:tetratricopeptide (TPR) repeat protein